MNRCAGPFVISPVPPSSNERDPAIRRAAREAFLVAIQCTVAGQLEPGVGYKLEVVFRGNWKDAAGRWRKRDHRNLSKLLEDAVCAALGIDDSLLVKTVYEKQHVDGVEEVEVWVEEVA